MRRKLTLSITFASIFVLASMLGPDAGAKAESQLRVTADTGPLSLIATQKHRVTGFGVGGGPHVVRFLRIDYAEAGCEGGVCRHTIASQTVSDRIDIAADEAYSFRVGPNINGNVRIVVLSDSRDVKVTGAISDAATGEIVAALDLNDLY